ncbi:MAG: SAM-dependent methyltransferase [Gammaproteobacteria bacterium]
MSDDPGFSSRSTVLQGLPAPDPIAQAHSLKLQELIAGEAAAHNGRITFARFMELALFAPGLGYYSGGSRKLGAEGDFITAPEWSPLFARCLARQVEQVLTVMNGGDILEVGPGSGMMAADLLEALERAACLPGRYYLLERSGELRARQQVILKNRLPHLYRRLVWLERLPEPGFRGVVLANELLDALPVHCFTVTDAGAAELYVRAGHGRWQWQADAPSSGELAGRIERLMQEMHLPVGYVSEINLNAEAWIRSVADLLETGLILLIDYGFPRHEYYHPDRSSGTLMCHYRHRAHDDPFVLVGLQDITAHVDFTAMAEAAHAAGLQVAGYTTQAAFLLANGIAEFMNDAGDERSRLERAQQIKTLTSPHEMGELFKVLALTRNFDGQLQGFTLRDLRRRL